MGVQVTIPQRPQSGGGLSGLLTIGGAIAGGLAGGLPGASLGATLGGTTGSLLTKPVAAQSGGAPTGPSDALSRRLQEINSSPQSQIADGIDSLKYIQDPSLKAQLAEPLMRANELAKIG